ncbi:MAG: class I SAM-dependent methyltransferase, partial [Polyangiales bacterium]
MHVEEQVRAQYEAFPYPPRRITDDAPAQILSPLENLPFILHHSRGGHWPMSKPWRVLVAGGGTGDAIVELGVQLKTAGIEAELTYLDLAERALNIARARAERHGVHATFHRASLLDTAARGLGPFDYINCSGVLHHLPDPGAGLRALAAVLAPGGTMGIMLYGALGRIGVYQAQQMLQLLGLHIAPDATKL